MLERIHNPNSINKSFIREKTNKGNCITIQFSDYHYYDDEMLLDIDELCKICNHNLVIRFHDHKGNFDCNILSQITHVKSLLLECDSVINVESLLKLKHLYYLNLNIYYLRDKGILEYENLFSLKKLTLGPTKNRIFDLQLLGKFHDLEKLFLCGQEKNIQTIGSIKSLKSLFLSSISAKVSLQFVNELPLLKSLTILLGSRHNIDEISNKSIEYLEINTVKLFNSLKNLNTLTGLRYLVIDHQQHLKELVFTESLSQLQSLRLMRCKNLSSIEGIHQLSRLSRLMICNSSLEFEPLLKQGLPPYLKKFHFSTGKKTFDSICGDKIMQLGCDAKIWRDDPTTL